MIKRNENDPQAVPLDNNSNQTSFQSKAGGAVQQQEQPKSKPLFELSEHSLPPSPAGEEPQKWQKEAKNSVPADKTTSKALSLQIESLTGQQGELFGQANGLASGTASGTAHINDGGDYMQTFEIGERFLPQPELLNDADLPPLSWDTLDDIVKISPAMNLASTIKKLKSAQTQYSNESNEAYPNTAKLSALAEKIKNFQQVIEHIQSTNNLSMSVREAQNELKARFETPKNAPIKRDKGGNNG